MSADAFLVAAFLLGYLLGSIPFGLILTRLAGTQDLRSIGSGNIGATNVLRTGRKGLAAATLLCDMLKGTIAVMIAGYYRRARRRDAGGARRLPRPPVSGVAQVQGRQRRRGLYRGADRAVLAGGGPVLRAVARDRRRDPLLVAVGAGSERGHPDFPVVVRPPRPRLPVRRADAAVVLHAPRKHQAVAGGDRRADRAARL